MTPTALPPKAIVQRLWLEQHRRQKDAVEQDIQRFKEDPLGFVMWAWPWGQKRTLWSKNVAEDQKALVLLGDSITQGWGARTEKEFPNVKIANRGIEERALDGARSPVDDAHRTEQHHALRIVDEW